MSSQPQPAEVPMFVAVTGHRDLLAEEVPGITERVREFLQSLGRKFPDTPVKILSPLADGGDRIVAREARALGLELVVPLPLPKALYQQDFTDTESRQEFEALCAKGSVYELPLAAGNTLASVSEYGPARDRQYAQLGVFLSSHCQILLALWDGKSQEQLGCTAQVVEYHLTDAMPGFSDAARTPQQLLTENENDLVYHIVCSRDRPGGEPAEGLQPVEGAWLTSDTRNGRVDELPDDYRLVFSRMGEFNRDARASAKPVETESMGLTGEASASVGRLDQHIERLFRAADWLASHYQRRVQLTLRATYTIAVLMGLAFIAYSDLPGQDNMIYAFLLLFAVGFWLYLVADRRDWHRKYLDYRVLAEGLRVQFFWHLAGVFAEGTSTKFAHDNFLQKQDVELGWIRHVMRAASLVGDATAEANSLAGLRHAIAEWVGDAGAGQLHYYASKAEERARRSQVTNRIGLACLWAGIAVTIFLAVMHTRLPGALKDPLIVLMGTLPLIAGVREAYAHKKAEKELIKQYRFMHKIFTNARKQLDGAGTMGAQREILKALGDAALDEHAEWILMHRERPLEHGKF